MVVKFVNLSKKICPKLQIQSLGEVGNPQCLAVFNPDTFSNRMIFVNSMAIFDKENLKKKET